VPREHLGHIWKLRRYSGSRKITEKRDCNNRGFGTIRFEVGPWDLFGRRRVLHNDQIWRNVHED
jgi:hypothetical protein